MASFLKKWKNKKTGNPQIGEEAEERIQEVINEQNRRRKKQSVSSRSSPFEPGFILKSRKIPKDIGDDTVRDLGYLMGKKGRTSSKMQLALEARRARQGSLDTADQITLDDEIKLKEKRTASREQRDGKRKNRSRRVSRVAAWKKAKEDAKKQQHKQSMEDIIKRVKNTRVRAETPGKSRIPELSPEMRIAFRWEHQESLKEMEKAKKKRKEDRRRKIEEEEEEERRRIEEEEKNKKEKDKQARRSKVVSDFKARKEELAATRRIKEEEEKLKEARKLHPFASKHDLADMTPEQMSKIAHRGKIRSPPPGNQTDRMIKRAENAKANRKKFKGYYKKTTAQAIAKAKRIKDKGKGGRKTRKKRRRKTRKKRRRRTKKKKNKKRRRTKKRRRK